MLFFDIELYEFFVYYEYHSPFPTLLGFPGGSDYKESACNVGDLDSVSGSGRSLGEGNGYQYSCLENSMEEPARLQSMVLLRVGHD